MRNLSSRNVVLLDQFLRLYLLKSEVAYFDALNYDSRFLHTLCTVLFSEVRHNVANLKYFSH